MNPELSVDPTESVGGNDLIEGGRTASILRLIVPAVPRTGEASVHNPPLPQRSSLVPTDIARGKPSILMTNQGDSLASDVEHPGLSLFESWDITHLDKTIGRSRGCGRSSDFFTSRCQKVQRGDHEESNTQENWVNGRSLRLKDSKGHVGNEQQVRRINKQMTGLPPASTQLLQPEIVTQGGKNQQHSQG